MIVMENIKPIIKVKENRLINHNLIEYYYPSKINYKSIIVMLQKEVGEKFVNNQGKLKSTKNKKSRQVYILDIFRELLISNASPFFSI